MSPWAILFEQKEIVWSFGIDEENFPDRARNLINGLQDFGQTLYGQGVTMVEFQIGTQIVSVRQPIVTNAPDQLFVINLSDYFLLLISDVQVLAAILPFIDLKSDIEDLLRSVLVAQGTNIYANLVLQANSEGEQAEIDHLFRKILRLTGRKDAKSLVIHGNCSLSPLNIPELLLFHVYLREHFHTLSIAKNLEQWSILSHKNGTELKHFYNIDADRAILLSGLLSAFINYSQYVFGIIPTRMIFGSTELQDIRIFASNDYFFAINNPDRLLTDLNFKKTFDLLHIEDKNDIIPSLIPFLQLETSKLIQKRLTSSFPKLLELYHTLHQDKDDLLNIKGIGPRSVEILQKMGISNITQLVQMKKMDIESICKQLDFQKSLSVHKILKWQTSGKRLLDKAQKILF